ncbi:hypothetical protein, partial [Streptomyces sp. 6N223]|uniref:hypothetical protein n=1 Tax=Streptomyces sp. 6N223 TaxID=3457412 RepID=UPI003FD3C774
MTDPHQHFFQFRRPDIGLHIIFHDQHNATAAPKVTNSASLTAHQPSTLRNPPLTSADSNLQLEY